MVDDLPEEVLLMIFRYLSTSDLINSIRKVCARWKRITKDRTLYQYVVIDQKLSLRAVLKLLRKNRKHITSIELKRRTDVNRILTLIPECTNLLSLRMVSCQGQVSIEVENTLPKNTIPIIHYTYVYRLSRLPFISPNEEKNQIRQEVNLR